MLLDANRKPIIRPNVTGTVSVDNGFAFTGYTDGRTKEIVKVPRGELPR